MLIILEATGRYDTGGYVNHLSLWNASYCCESQLLLWRVYFINGSHLSLKTVEVYILKIKLPLFSDMHKYENQNLSSFI
jgi:hypothetical protein